MSKYESIESTPMEEKTAELMKVKKLRAELKREDEKLEMRERQLKDALVSNVKVKGYIQVPLDTIQHYCDYGMKYNWIDTLDYRNDPQEPAITDICEAILFSPLRKSPARNVDFSGNIIKF